MHKNNSTTNQLDEENQEQLVKCNWCDWKGNADQLELEDKNEFENIEHCPNCGEEDYLEDIIK